MHDVLRKNGSIEADIFEKYRRRHKRLINKLKNEDNLLFFYNKKLTEEELNKICNMLNKIRNGKKWALIQFYNDENDEEIRNEGNIYYLNLDNLLLNKQYRRMQQTNINLQKFFNKCLNFYQEEFN